MPSRRAGLAAGTDYKMVLVVRGELRLTAGKAAAQVAHAAVMLVLSAEKRHAESLAVWLQAGQKKIVLSAPSLADLESIASNARAPRDPSGLGRGCRSDRGRPGNSNLYRPRPLACGPVGPRNGLARASVDSGPTGAP